MAWIIGIAVAVMALWLAIGFMARMSLVAMTDPSHRLEPITDDRFSEQLGAVNEVHDWAEGQGFQWLNHYVIHLGGGTSIDTHVAAWQTPDQTRFFLRYHVVPRSGNVEPKTTFDFVTAFTNDAVNT